MSKHWEEEAWRIEHEANARITFTIALHGKHAWEMRLEDSDRYHSIGHGWATDNPHEWEAAIAPVLRRLFINGRLRFATEVPVYDPPNGTSANTSVPMYDPPLCSPETRGVVAINGGQNATEPYRQAVLTPQNMVAAE
jgi:hypothetical protein